VIEPDWPAPPRVRALVTTRAEGDMASEEGRRGLRALLPADPQWLQQVHGAAVAGESLVADAAVARVAGKVCVVKIADCMPVLFADEQASVVGVAHAGWRGLAAGVLEATVDAMGVAPGRLLAWMGPAIGPRVYEVGEDVRRVFADRHFVANRPGHWLLDLYSVAREKLAARGVARVFGGGFCTHSDRDRFFSYRRDGSSGRMAAAIWLT
jgi:polyphenol oxidase